MMMAERALLSSTYFGPVQWYQKLNTYPTVCLERYDHFVKQTYRNRCVIPTTQGVQTLTVPVERTGGEKCLMKDIRISDHGNWRHLHWNALMSAYGESPFFEYYADDIRPFFEKRWDYLFDFNLEITQTLCELLDIHPNISLTDDYIPSDGEGIHQQQWDDYREAIRPKHPAEDSSFIPKKYWQVYQQKLGFLPNMSVLDLLFNMGNESPFFLDAAHEGNQPL